MFIWVDLFSGCGGMATGMCEALECAGIRHKGYAINHSPFAVATMRANHADVTTLEMDLDVAVPSEVVPEWRIDHLHASPSCTHHSRAKGGRPRSNQLRSQPDIITRWIDEHFIPSISVENVPEFMDWGPLDSKGMPIERLKGECFRAWVGGLEAKSGSVAGAQRSCRAWWRSPSASQSVIRTADCGRTEGEENADN